MRLPKLRLSATREVADGTQLAEMRFLTWTFRCDYRLHIAFFRAEFAPRKNNAQKQMRKPRSTERERTDDTLRLSATPGVRSLPKCAFSHGHFVATTGFFRAEFEEEHQEKTMRGNMRTPRCSARRSASGRRYTGRERTVRSLPKCAAGCLVSSLPECATNCKRRGVQAHGK